MLAFINIVYFGLGYRLYELIQNDLLFYSIQITVLFLLNILIIKKKTRAKIIYNFIFISGLFILFVFPYIRGEKIYNKINCTYELVNSVKEYRNRKGILPLNLSEIEKPQCKSDINIVHYEIINKDEYNQTNKGYIPDEKLLTEDSFIITLRITELTPMSLKFAGHRKEFYND